MSNDIWYLGQGYWAVYTEDSSVAEKLHNINDVHLVTVYRHVRKSGILAMQFTFYGGSDLRQGQCKLSEVCYLIGLDFKRVLSLGKRCDYLPYSRKYYPNGEQIQLMFCDKTKRNKRKAKVT